MKRELFVIPSLTVASENLFQRAQLWPVSILLAGSLVLFSGFSAKGAPASGRLLVANKGDRTLSIIDPDTDKQIVAVPEQGITGHEVAASLDGKRAFVPIYGNSGVGRPGTDGQLMRVIDLESHDIVGTVDFGKGVRPHCAVINRKTGLLYITTENERAITIVDPASLKIVGTIPTGAEQSHMLAVSADGRYGYTSNVKPGSVSVLDLKERKVLQVLPVCDVAQRISLSVDGRFVFTSDQITPRLAVIDTARVGVKQWVTLPGTGYGTAPTPDGKTLVVAIIDKNEVALVDLESMKVTGEIPVPKAPQEVLVRPDGAVAYVSCDASRQVAVIDLKNRKVRSLIDAGAGADGLAWAEAR
jgi:DNA-binding beta-propeller fold protein YncE